MARPKKTVEVQKELFVTLGDNTTDSSFYIGDPKKIYTPEKAARVLKCIKHDKSICGYCPEENFYFMRCRFPKNSLFVDMVEYNTTFTTDSDVIVVTPTDNETQTRVRGCLRFRAKQVQLRMLQTLFDSCIYVKKTDDAGFIHFIEEIKHHEN